MFKKGEQREITDLIESMLDSYNQTQDSMLDIDRIAEQSKMLAISSARELGRMENAGGFQIITQKIRVFADENRRANQQNKDNVNKLNDEICNMVGVRTADVAYDLIEKIERNLFERYCDVQAWAAMAIIVEFAKNQAEQIGKRATQVLRKLHQIYEMYHDIVITDLEGKILASATRQEIVGKDASEEEWFQKGKDAGVHVTDMHYSDYWKEYVVSYSSAIVAEDGAVLGVLTTQFNWKYILDMIDAAKISKKGEVYLINKEGQVIGARERKLIFHKNMLLECQGAQTILAGEGKKKYGYALERNEAQQLTRVLGYARTSGYNQYAGKEWAVLALENIR